MVISRKVLNVGFMVLQMPKIDEYKRSQTKIRYVGPAPLMHTRHPYGVLIIEWRHTHEMEETSTELAIGGETVSFSSTSEIDNGATYKAQ